MSRLRLSVPSLSFSWLVVAVVIGTSSLGSSAFAQERQHVSSEALSDLPSNLTVPVALRPVLRRALERSPLFREQVAALARKPQVRMMVSYGGTRGERPYYALSVVRKHQWGAMYVDTTLYVPADVIELIGHELEHVREQMEGLDLRTLSYDRNSGVFDLNGHYETMRAIEAGQRVTREFQGVGVEVPGTH